MPRNPIRKTQSKSAGKQSAIVRRTPTEVEDDLINDEMNENESLNQEESSIINNETSIPAPPNPSSVNRTALKEVKIINLMPLINHLRMHR